MKAPTHEAVAQRAAEIWQSHGRPSGRDTEFWFEAEHELAAETTEIHVHTAAGENALRIHEATGVAEAVEHAAKAQASDDEGWGPVPPPTSENEGVRAARQRKEGRAPIVPVKNAPKAAPPEHGKPLWPQSHSS